MKKTFLLLIILLCGTVLPAQIPDGGHRHRRPNHEPPKVEEMVSNLSAIQKKRLEGITESCKKQVDKLQKELDGVRSHIRTLMGQDGDQSEKLFPLIDREASLQSQIAKEMYRTRVQIDEVLTEEQLAEFRARCKADRKNRKADAPRGKAPKGKR
ncbi:MAG: periplasmic heavy metal sensor [Bacteroidales bacterium]|nr:periplasmic heavy metal sensor [Bacteroidales bacterium]